MRIKTLLCVIPFSVFALSPMAHAQDADDTGLPPVRLMSCQGQCANFVPAKPRFRDKIRFSSTQYGLSRAFPEGRVRLLYTVGPDGKVRHDILVLSQIGPREFVDRALEKVRTWSFEPATSDGKPVAQSLTQDFSFNHQGMGAVPDDIHFDAAQALKALPALMEQGKAEQARATLEDVLQKSKLNFGSRAAVASALAELAYQRGDYLEARRFAVMTTVSNIKHRDAWLTRIKADLMLGDVTDALYCYAMLQRTVGKFAPESALPKLMEKTLATANTATLLAAQAQIPVTEEGDVYTLLPYRRSFTFQKIEGSLQKFVLACNQATMESDITPAAQWRIPDKWDGCSVYVRGTPGTKFLVVQPKD